MPNPVSVDYDSGLSAISIDLYYHTSDHEKRCMFPIDPALPNLRAVTTIWTTLRQANLREDVKERDRSCVVTGELPRDCDAAHLLPHSKGDTYIETFSTHRRRDSSGDNDIVRNIDDVRNGLFLNALLHHTELCYGHD